MARLANGEDACSPFAWLQNMTLDRAVHTSLGDYEKILTVNIEQGSTTGNSNLSLMFRIKAEVELKDGSTSTVSFVLKGQNDNFFTGITILKLRLIPRETLVYYTIIPKLEQIYKDAGKTVKFSPEAYKFDQDTEEHYVLLEDLHVRDYKNANSATGFDMQHMQQTLSKLAEFHAASACYVEHFGCYDEELTVGIYNCYNQYLYEEFTESSVFLAQLKKWKNGQEYYGKLAKSDDYLVECLLERHRVNPREFNVLNHGDCWSDNVMFQYDNEGKIKDTLFVDFQVTKYGSPANDLYYLILSSANPDIKLTQFDYFVRFYYERLVENLKFLQYHRPLPKLKSLHSALLRNGLSAYMVATKVLPVIMLDKDAAKLEDETKMKQAMYANPKYVQMMSELMPWLANRGLLDWK